MSLSWVSDFVGEDQSSDAGETKPILTFKNGQLVDENGSIYGSQLASAALTGMNFNGSLNWYENAKAAQDVYNEHRCRMLTILKRENNADSRYNLLLLRK
ncbi:MAG: hypothetical protein OEY38_23885 [Gammaproteobacteria bacterium]|nr:hypothetical protein [Gammaproteobacteria bacterium]